MKAIKITILLLFLTGTIYAQNCCESGECYIRLNDISGVDTDTFQNSLKAAACELVQAFPDDFRRDFRVYDFGFYLHNENFDGNYPAVFEQVKSQIDKPYYLLFGKQTDSTGVYSKIWVEVKLPETNIFECYTDADINYINSSVKNATEKSFNSGKKYPFEFANAEKKGIYELHKIIEKAKICCYQGTVRRESNCYMCPDDLDNIMAMMEENGFIKIPLENLTVLPLLDTTGIVKQYAHLQIGVNGKDINVNSDIISFLSKLNSHMDGIRGTISNYDFVNPNCLEVMDIINYGNQTYNPAALIGGNGKRPKFSKKIKKVKIRGNGDEFDLYRVDIISIKNSLQKPFLFIRTITDLENGNISSPATIHIVKLEDADINISKVISHVDSFYTLINVNVNIDSDFIYEDEIKGTKDAISIIGNSASEIIGLIRGTYCNLAIEWNDALIDFMDDRGILEKGQTNNSRRLSMVSLDRIDNNVISDFATKTIEKTVGFLIFHATGHNAGITHDYDCLDRKGYMSNGNLISYFLGNKNPTCGFCYEFYDSVQDAIDEGACKTSIEELIKDTPQFIINLVRKRYEGN